VSWGLEGLYVSISISRTGEVPDDYLEVEYSMGEAV
jgi:hypothetical protein